MDPLPVTLIVKAPNQQFEDQTIKCEPTWSIRKLKGYLTEVYPCNPVRKINTLGKPVCKKETQSLSLNCEKS